MSANSSVALPPQLTARPVTLDDVDAVWALMVASALSATGEPDTSRAQVVDELMVPALDRERDTWLVHGSDGTALGVGFAVDDHADRASLDVYLRPDLSDDAYATIGGWLVRRSLDRIAEFVASSGRPNVQATTGAYGDEHRQLRLLQDAGFVPDRTYWRMRCDLDGRTWSKALPSGVRLRRLELDDAADRRVAHHIATVAFRGHHEHVDHSEQEFFARTLGRSATDDPSMWWLALVDEQPAGLLIGNETRIDEGGGYVRTLGVLHEHRGRGVAKALLRRAFDEYTGRGRTTVSLAVDSENSTGATALYDAVGMRVVVRVINLSREVEAG